MHNWLAKLKEYWSLRNLEKLDRENKRLMAKLEHQIQFSADLQQQMYQKEELLVKMQKMHDLQLKTIAVYEFDWEVNDQMTRDQRIRILNDAFLIDGFKELLGNNIYQYKKRFIESKEQDNKALYWAEVYQNILSKMKASHELFLKGKQSVSMTDEPDNV